MVAELNDLIIAFLLRRVKELIGLCCAILGGTVLLSLVSWSKYDPTLSYNGELNVPKNLLGAHGAIISDLLIQFLGMTAFTIPLWLIFVGFYLMLSIHPKHIGYRLIVFVLTIVGLCLISSALYPNVSWLLKLGAGGIVGDMSLKLFHNLTSGLPLEVERGGLVLLLFLTSALGIDAFNYRESSWITLVYRTLHLKTPVANPLHSSLQTDQIDPLFARSAFNRVHTHTPYPRASLNESKEFSTLFTRQNETFPYASDHNSTTFRNYGSRSSSKMCTLPPLSFLKTSCQTNYLQQIDLEFLESQAQRMEDVLDSFGVRGDILAVRPGPVVTLYELEPAPGTKSSRVIALADDIARSMSAVSARVAVIPGRNVIGIELPNDTRETVYLRDLIAAPDFSQTSHSLALCLGKTIGGEPVVADLAKMPHLLIAGTTGSGKSVAINTMILSLLYRLTPQQCRLIMVDPKMLELSVYDGIPHLLSPVVTDPKKAVTSLKWAVREMEERYKKMAKLGVRNIDGYNQKIAELHDKHITPHRTVQTGFDPLSGQPLFETEPLDLAPLPFIVIVVDEMADLMMVAGKDIESAIQRLAQMARAAGIHLIMATQRPSVDVITGTIKANFPTRISFQVTSKIDSRTILGEMGAEQLLGQGDMLFMAGGGKTIRVHGPFCSDLEVETVVSFLKQQGRPLYLNDVTSLDDPTQDEPKKQKSLKTELDDELAELSPLSVPLKDASTDLYQQAINIVLRDKKASTSYIQRRLQIGYNRAASLMEKMEQDGIVGPANHTGRREIYPNAVHDEVPTA